MENPYQASVVPVTEEQSTESNADLELAPRGHRLGAAILDSIFGGIFIVAVLFAAGFVSGIFLEDAEAFWVNNFGGGPDGQMSWLGAALLMAVALSGWLLINGYFIVRNGQTLGKLILKIKMVRADSGALPSLPRVVFLRFLPVNLVALIPLVGNLILLADALFIFGDERRCLHDRIAGTRVVLAVPSVDASQVVA